MYDAAQRVAIDNLAGWELNFRALTRERDISIPANARGYKGLTFGEIEEQIACGNAFFSADGAKLRICDEGQRAELLPDAPRELIGDAELETLLTTRPREKFLSEFKRLITTSGDRRALAAYAGKRGVDELEAYKLDAIKRAAETGDTNGNDI